jgi:hypothetical protein
VIDLFVSLGRGSPTCSVLLELRSQLWWGTLFKSTFIHVHTGAQSYEIRRPIVLALFLGYIIVVLAGLLLLRFQTSLARTILWLYGQAKTLRKFSLTSKLDIALIKVIKRSRRKVICIWVKTDDVSFQISNTYSWLTVFRCTTS